jgi:hypothetical protein
VDRGTLNVFVIMPFTVRQADLATYGGDPEHWREVYEGLILPAVRKAGMNCERDDDDLRSRLIGDGIWRKIEQADLVVCDVSSANANVFLELGWALRADKRFVLIKDDLADIHFDLNQFYTYTYNHRLKPSDVREGIVRLSEVIGRTLDDKEQNYSIVRKVGLDVRAAEVSTPGNLEVGLLRQVLAEIRAIRPMTRTAPSVARGPRQRVVIFWHDVGLTFDNAEELAAALSALGCDVATFSHRDKTAPDAIFVSERADPEIVRAALRKLHPRPSYIFPTTYSSEECGAPSEYVLSLGLHSTWCAGQRPVTDEPVQLSEAFWGQLTGSTVSRKEFIRFLKSITNQ